MSDLTFGVFVPQGWKMELASIEDPQAKWQRAVDTAVRAEELGYDSVWVYDHFHNVPTPAHEAVFECWTTHRGDQPAHQPHPARARWSAAPPTGTRPCWRRSPRRST